MKIRRIVSDLRRESKLRLNRRNIMPSFSKVYESIDELLNQVSDKSIPDWKSEHDSDCRPLASERQTKRLEWQRNAQASDQACPIRMARG